MSPVLGFDGVSKSFTLVHNRADSLKSKLIGFVHPRYQERRETHWALRDVSLEVRKGESIGIIGRNGSGKSTLLKVAAGILPPTSGAIARAPGLRVGTMIELGVGFHPELTGRENVFLGAAMHGLSERETERLLPGIVDFSGLQEFMDIPLKNYSTGMQMRLGFALEAELWPDLLLLDEILAVGDAEFQKRCLQRVRDYKSRGGSILFVSHSPELVREYCDRALALERGRVLALGPVDEAIEALSLVLAGKDPARDLAVALQVEAQP